VHPPGGRGTPARAGTGLQLRLARRELELRGIPAGHHRQPRRRAAAGVVHHLGALQPRRSPARHALRPAPRGPPRQRQDVAADRRRLPETGSRPRPAAGPGRDPADAGPARLGVPVPGRGTGPARGARHPRGPGPGPGLQPVARRGEGPRWLPGPAALDGGRCVVRIRARRCSPAAAGLVRPAERRGPGAGPGLHPVALPQRPALAAPAAGRGEHGVAARHQRPGAALRPAGRLALRDQLRPRARLSGQPPFPPRRGC
jgi:hypothetical protein